MDVLCEVKEVSRDFATPAGPALRVLDKVSLQIRPREVVCLLGPSGCGKSTLLRILAGLIPATEGEVLYHGEPLKGLSPGVAMVFQAFALYPWLTVADNVKAVLKALGLPEAEAQSRAAAAIQTVGLAGFEEAYPRELSGGMKQRAGTARALSTRPELLFMDEPFSQVDSLTAESLRSDILEIWGKGEKPLSIVMVSHDIKEVAYMADRIVVFSANPGRIRTIVENKLPRPRDYRSPELLKLVDQLHDIITGSELPDAVPVTGPAECEALPEARSNEIIGLLEYLAARQGRADLFATGAEMRHRFDRMILITQAAELLGLVDTPGREIVISSLGRKVVEADIGTRKLLWKAQLLTVGLFKHVFEMLSKQASHSLPLDVIHSMLVLQLPHERPEALFRTLIGWARFGNLFAYDARTRMISLQ